MDSLHDLKSQVIESVNSSISKIKTATSLKDLQELNINILGKNGTFSKFFSVVSKLSKNEKIIYGSLLNTKKKDIISAMKAKEKQISTGYKKNYTEDPTLPFNTTPLGSIHLITKTIDLVRSIFSNIGFIHISYPEVEYEYYAFDALNMPPEHPARDDFEAIFLELPINKKYGKRVLSPHTSSGQLREMERLKKPPIRMINIAKCYRPNWDATHTPMFHQFEGFCIDKDIHLGHLKWTLDYFAESYFGRGVKTRLRPFHFQFTEPSFEVDITCIVCNGKGKNTDGKICNVCKSGWMELGGTGMVHPNVLKSGNINPDKYSGWAFGFGIERIIMMRYAIPDIRLFYENDIRFLTQW